VVASGCPEEALAPTRALAERIDKVALLVEDMRHGKAEAINRIIAEASGDFLVMLNADAFPLPGSIAKLLEVARDPMVGAVSAMPVFEEKGGLLRHSLSLMWSAHNSLSLSLNHAGVSNHACDELILVRRRLVSSLPSNLVNDGAYIGGLVRSKGYSVKFSTAAKVNIAVPSLLVDLVRQRRRIIYGHVQVWKKLGRPPRTVESLMFSDPITSLKTLVKVLAGRPRLVTALPVVLAGESISGLLGIVDALRSSEAHAVWKRNAR